MHRTLMALALSALTPAVAAAAPAGRVTSGWPILSVGADAIHVGSDGGPVVIDWSDDPSVVGAYTPVGTPRWGRGATWGCGNCPGFFHNPAASAPYGQIGPQSGLYSDTGATVEPLPAFGVTAQPVSDSTTKVSRTLTGAPRPLWETTLPAPFSDRYESGDPPLLVTGSTIFITPGELTTTGSGDTLFALDLMSGSIRWQRPDTIVIAAVDHGGVLVQESTGAWLILNADGSERAALEPPTDVTFAAASGPHGRIYFRGNATARIFAVDTATGEVAWSTPPALNVRLLTSEANGTVLLAFRVGARHGVYAMSPAGARLWSLRTLDAVTAARLLPGGTVALASGRRTGLLWRINPKVTQTLPARFNVSLSRVRFRAVTEAGNAADWKVLMGRDRGTIVTLRSPTARTMALRVIETTATGGRQVGRWERLEVPAGRSDTRVDLWAPGTVRVQLRRGITGPIVFDRTLTVTRG